MAGRRRNKGAMMPGITVGGMIDRYDVTTMEEPVPTWEHVDANGHVHRWDGWGLPTLRVVEDYPDTDNYPATRHYECKICGERVEPAMRATQCRRYVYLRV